MTTEILIFISFDQINKYINGYYCIVYNALNNNIIISVVPTENS